MSIDHSDESLFNAVMIDWLRAQLSWALHRKQMLIPDFVPCRVRVQNDIAAPFAKVPAGEYECEATLTGEVRVCKHGTLTALLPLEFEVLEFRNNRKKELYLAEKETAKCSGESS